MKKMKLTTTTIPVLALAWLILSVAGCSVGPDYVVPDQALPDTWKSPVPGAAGSTDPKALAEWWKNLGDPQLTSLVERAVGNNLDLKKAWARVKEVKARRGIARADFAPTISANGSGSSNWSNDPLALDQTTTPYKAGLDASWEIDIFGGTRRSVEAAQADYEAAQESLHDVLVSLVAEVATNYVQLRTYQKRLSVAEENLKLQTETLQLTVWQNETGLTSNFDVERARYNLESTRSAIPRLQSSLAEAKNRLAVLLGGWPGTLENELSAPAPIPTGSWQIAVGLPAELLRRRPDVRQAERALAAQTARIGVAEAELYPKLTLNGSLGYSSLALDSLMSPANLATSLGASVLVKLFQGGALRENIKVQDALQEQALAAYETTVLTALEEVENSLMSLAKENERRESLDRAFRSAEQAVQMALQQYQSGSVDFTTVLETQQSLASFQDKLADSEGAMTLDLISLYKALGGGWSPDQPIQKPTQTGTKTTN